MAVVCGVSAQNPAGFAYNPYLYFPYSALQPPAQETAEVAAARAAHQAAHTAAAASAARAAEPAAPLPAGFAYNPFLYFPYTAMQAPAQETPEVAAARATHMAALAAASGRVKRSVPDTPEVIAAKVEHYRAYNAAAAANGIVAYLPAQYDGMPFALPQPVKEAPDVAAARAEFMRAYNAAVARG